MKRRFGLTVLLGWAVASYGLQAKAVEPPRSGMDVTVCNSTATIPCSVPPAEAAAKMGEIIAMLRVLRGEEFESNYQKYLLGPSPTVIFIPREEMIRIANARPDGKARSGEFTQGLNLNYERIVVVYDDIAPLFVARSINHEIGHRQLRDAGLSSDDEEAKVRKIVDTAFFARVFGRRWLESTTAALERAVLPAEKNGRVYKGHTPQAVAELYERLRAGGVNVKRSMVHDRILETLVFILTNSEESLSAALAAADTQQ